MPPGPGKACHTASVVGCRSISSTTRAKRRTRATDERSRAGSQPCASTIHSVPRGMGGKGTPHELTTARLRMTNRSGFARRELPGGHRQTQLARITVPKRRVRHDCGLAASESEVRDILVEEADAQCVRAPFGCDLEFASLHSIEGPIDAPRAGEGS